MYNIVSYYQQNVKRNELFKCFGVRRGLPVRSCVTCHCFNTATQSQGAEHSYSPRHLNDLELVLINTQLLLLSNISLLSMNRKVENRKVK